MSSDTGLNTPAIIELFGHTKIAGYCTDQAVAGLNMIHVQVPDTKSGAGYSRLLNPAAVYAINPVSEDIMKAVAETIKAVPVRAYELPSSLLIKNSEEE